MGGTQQTWVHGTCHWPGYLFSLAQVPEGVPFCCWIQFRSSEDADSPINLVEIRFLHYSCKYWEFPRGKMIVKWGCEICHYRAMHTKCTKWNHEVMGSWGEGGNLMKPPEFFMVMLIFLKWMWNKCIRGGQSRIIKKLRFEIIQKFWFLNFALQGV